MRSDGERVSGHFLVQGKLKVCSKWNAIRVTCRRGVVKEC